MIRIDRGGLDEQGNTIFPLGTWMQRASTQTAKARADGPTHEVSALYRDDDLKVALHELFHGKCAYCENGGLSGFDWDVEHFRPKGRVAEDTSHPGYYWLAYTWENLYPSCVFCNQRRKDKPTYSNPTVGKATGKLDQFPLEAGSARVSDPAGDLTTERPAILDPCADEPSAHLAFKPDGSITAKPGSTRGKKSIEVFGLFRKTLKDDRRKTLRTVEDITSSIMGVNPNVTRENALKSAFDALSRPTMSFSAVVLAAMDDPAAFGF